MTASPVLAAFGNPLLDIIVREGCEGLVEKYGLARNIAQEVDTIKTGLHAEVTQRSNLEYSGGGCALNTVRVFQWLSPTPNSAVFLGGLGKDDSGAVLESLVNSDAVLTAFAKQDDLPTGHCIALVEGAERTLAANLGAANKFSAEDLWQGNNRTLLEGAKVIYVEGYFLSHSPEAAMELASEFEVFIDTIEAKLETSSSVIRNLRAMIRSEGVENLDMKIENICESPVRSKPKSLIAVVTEGCEPVQCYSIGERLKTVSVDVPRLPQAAVKIWTAQKMIQQVGVTLPKSKPEPPMLPMGKKGMKRSASCSQDSNPGIGPVVPTERAKIRS